MSKYESCLEGLGEGLHCMEAEMKRDICAWCDSFIPNQTSKRWHDMGNICGVCMSEVNARMKSNPIEVV